MLLSGVRSSWDMLARNSDLYFEVSASSVGLFFQRAARLFDFLVLAFHLDVAARRAAAAFCSSCSLVCCSSLLLRLQFAGELLRLLQQAFGLHRGLDAC